MPRKHKPQPRKHRCFLVIDGKTIKTDSDHFPKTHEQWLALLPAILDGRLDLQAAPRKGDLIRYMSQRGLIVEYFKPRERLIVIE